MKLADDVKPPNMHYNLSRGHTDEIRRIMINKPMKLLISCGGQSINIYDLKFMNENNPPLLIYYLKAIDCESDIVNWVTVFKTRVSWNIKKAFKKTKKWLISSSEPIKKSNPA